MSGFEALSFRQAGALLRPDLARVHARVLEFSCEVTPRPEQLQRLQSAFARSEHYGEFPWLFLNRYKASGLMHVATALVSRSNQRDSSLEIEFRFGTRARFTLPFKTKPVIELVSVLSEWKTEAIFDCTVNLLYPEKGWTSRISLPMRLFEYVDLPFDEFRGFRAVKVEDGRTAYSVIVDRPENKTLSHVVLFSHSAPINDRLGDDILVQGANISSLFVRADEE